MALTDKSVLDESGLSHLWEHISVGLSSKVDKIDGKGLSTLDYNDSEQGRITAIEERMEALELDAITPIEKGGTGATTIANARTNLEVYSTVEIDSKLEDKSDIFHKHDNDYDIKGAAADSLTNAKAYTDTVADSKANEIHRHNISDVTDLQTTLDNKASQTELGAHTNDTIKHVATSERENWNSTLANAKAYADGLADTKSDIGHMHNDMYYTESEIDNKVTEINTSISNIVNGTTMASKANHALTSDSTTNAKLAEKAVADNNGSSIVDTYETKAEAQSKFSDAKSYADGIKNDLLNGAGAAYDTLKELGMLIDDNTDAIEALEILAASKANEIHEHKISEVIDLKTTLDSLADNIVNAEQNAINSANSYTDTQTKDMFNLVSNLASNADNITSGVLSSDRLPIVPVSKGGTDADNRKDAFKNLAFLGLNPIITIANDTVEKWKELGSGYAFYTQSDSLLNQPSQYGFVINYVYGNDVFQMWKNQTYGSIFYRGGNYTGWANENRWDKIIVNTEIINNLVTNVADKPLSANQGVVLKGLIDKLNEDKANTNELPTKVSQLENDKGYLTQHQSLTDYAKKTEVQDDISSHNISDTSHNDIRLKLEEFNTKLSNFLDSDDTTLDELSELISAIKANQGTIELLTNGKVNTADIIDNLTTSAANKPLSANQGVELKELIDSKTAVSMGGSYWYSDPYSNGIYPIDVPVNTRVKIDDFRSVDNFNLLKVVSVNMTVKGNNNLYWYFSGTPFISSLNVTNTTSTEIVFIGCVEAITSVGLDYTANNSGVIHGRLYVDKNDDGSVDLSLEWYGSSSNATPNDNLEITSLGVRYLYVA